LAENPGDKPARQFGRAAGLRARWAARLFPAARLPEPIPGISNWLGAGKMINSGAKNSRGLRSRA